MMGYYTTGKQKKITIIENCNIGTSKKLGIAKNNFFEAKQGVEILAMKRIKWRKKKGVSGCRPRQNARGLLRIVSKSVTIFLKNK